MQRALLIEPDLQGLHALAHLVEQHGFATSAVGSLRQARAELDCNRPDLVIVNWSLPDGNAGPLLDTLVQRGLGDIIITVEAADIDSAVTCLRHGVRDYLTKPIDQERLTRHLTDIAKSTMTGDHSAAPGDDDRFGPMLGRSPVMQKLYHLIQRVAATDATVLIVGESGVGKELVAQTIHQHSARHDKPFLTLNCGAVPANLIESELFGHEKGAFTGAERFRRGVFERADGGTLLLDEVMEMPQELQVKLLRVLESGRFVRVGGEEEIAVDVRVLAATNREPAAAVAEHRFREDLLYRLSVFPLSVPPLRERGSDVELLAHQFLAELNRQANTDKRFEPRALEHMRQYFWPGNVRQLHNLVHRAFIVSDQAISANMLIRPDDWSQRHGDSGGAARLWVPLGATIAEVERRMIYEALRRFGGDKPRVARALGVSLKTIYNRLNAYQGTPPDGGEAGGKSEDKSGSESGGKSGRESGGESGGESTPEPCEALAV